MVSGLSSARRLIRPNDFDTSTELTDWGMAILLSGKYGVSGEIARSTCAVQATAEQEQGPLRRREASPVRGPRA